MTDHEARIAALEKVVATLHPGYVPRKRKPREWWIEEGDAYDVACHQPFKGRIPTREVLPPSGVKPRVGYVTFNSNYPPNYLAVELTDEVREALLMAGISV